MGIVITDLWLEGKFIENFGLLVNILNLMIYTIQLIEEIAIENIAYDKNSGFSLSSEF